MKWFVWAALALLLGGAGYIGFRVYSAGRSAQPTYRTIPVRHTDVSQSITATGTIVPEDVIDVGAQVNGQIASFGTDKAGKLVDYRSEVEQGAILAKIDDSLFAADLASAQAQLSQAQALVGVNTANRDAAKAKLEQTRRDWERAQRLGNTAALARAEYDAAQSAFEQATAAVAQAEASITQAQAEVSQAEASVLRAKRNLGFCIIYSPVSGVIIDKRVEIGQTVVASLSAPSLFLIAKDLKQMQILVQVNEADVGNILPNQRVRFTSDAFSNHTFKGEVRKVRLNAAMTQNVVTYTVEIVTDNADLTLLPYLTANVRFEIAKHNGVLAVPNAALRWSPRVTAPAPAAIASGAAPGSQPGTNTTSSPGVDPSGPQRRGPGKMAEGEEGVRMGTLYILQSGQPQAVSVKLGISDGTVTEVAGDGITEGVEVVTGELGGGQPAAAAGGTNPFAPPMMRGGGRGR
jgi:HlyD family secretion protein